MPTKVLVIDDDPNVSELIKIILKPRGLLTFHAPDGKAGLKKAYELQPDIIILDIMMPEHDGYEICARLREFSDVPILMLTAKSQSSDVTRGFSVGADDYVKKPFSNDELISRIESLIRRNNTAKASTNITGYSDGFLEIELASQKVSLQGEEITFTPTEFKLLATMIRHPNKTLTTRTLLTEVWGNAYSYDKSLLSLYIHQLRQKLKERETKHEYIKTQWGQGYWFNPLPHSTRAVIVPPTSEQDLEEQKPPKQFYENKWGWVVLGVFIGVLAYVLFQQYYSFLFRLNVVPGFPGGYTTIEAQVSEEGFIEAQMAEKGNMGTEFTSLHGQICVKNTGDFPTEDLSMVTSVQINSNL